MSELKPEFKNDDEFKCIRRIACKLGLSMPESDDEVLRLTHYRRIENAINKLFSDTITEQEKVISELEERMESIFEYANMIPLHLTDENNHANQHIRYFVENIKELAKHKQSKGE